jgi:hypothetical protein
VTRKHAPIGGPPETAAEARALAALVDAREAVARAHDALWFSYPAKLGHLADLRSARDVLDEAIREHRAFLRRGRSACAAAKRADCTVDLRVVVLPASSLRPPHFPALEEGPHATE